MKKFASIVTLAVLAATGASAESYNAHENSGPSQLIGEVVQVPAADVVIAGDFVNSDTVPLTVVETYVSSPVSSPR